MSQNQLFTEAFVEEVLVEVDNDELKSRTDLDSNIDQELLQDAPHNSAIIRILSGDKVTKQDIAYPLFPPHILMPINSGDHVWTLTLAGQIYWIARRNYSSIVDDLSSVYAERSAGVEQNSGDTVEQFNRAKTQNSILPRTSSSITTVFKDANLEFIDKLKEKRKIIPEVVPRFKKRPGDLVIQGSSNTLISLGSDRGFKKEDEVDLTTPTSALDIPVQYSGTIDIVTGRGRYQPINHTSDSAVGDKPWRTAVATIVNVLGDIESDKNPDENELPDQNISSNF